MSFVYNYNLTADFLAASEVDVVALQAEIDALVAKYKNGRSFVRPSGTEDVVRVYAEASTRSEADELANEAARIVYDMCQGVGERL